MLEYRLIFRLSKTYKSASKNLISNRIMANNMMTTAARAEKAMEEISKNTYYAKYADKIAKLQQTSPEEFLSRVDQLEKAKTPQKQAKNTAEPGYSQLLNPKKPIDSAESKQASLEQVMKIDLIRDKSRDEIKEIWREYHLQKDVIAAVIPGEDFDELSNNSQRFPTFLFPLPRKQGYEFIMCQFDKNCVHFTPLLYYQVHKENAPECLTMTHYVELKDDKNIVLMRGEYDKNIIDLNEARCLANQLQLYYVKPDEEKVGLLKRFNQKPDEFKHMDLIKQIENLSL